MNKDVCRSCLNKSFPHAPWNEHDEKQWEAGSVFCFALDSYHRPVKNDPPKDCPFILEHVVFENKSPIGASKDVS